jgi:histidinol phosphatase-like PHP family hydrolase
MLMRAYGIMPEENPQDNFLDGGNSYYTGYLAAAKTRGISKGIGNNRFGPNLEITRQEMFTLVYNALKTIDKLPTGLTGNKVESYSDAGEIAPWAAEAMKLLVETGTIVGSGNKLYPVNKSTRAEMAQVLYNLLSK